MGRTSVFSENTVTSFPYYVCRDKVEFISKNVHGKLAIRAVLNRDMKLMQSLMEDKEEIYRVKYNKNHFSKPLCYVYVCGTEPGYTLPLQNSVYPDQLASEAN